MIFLRTDIVEISQVRLDQLAVVEGPAVPARVNPLPGLAHLDLLTAFLALERRTAGLESRGFEVSP